MPTNGFLVGGRGLNPKTPGKTTGGWGRCPQGKPPAQVIADSVTPGAGPRGSALAPCPSSSNTPAPHRVDAYLSR